MKTFLAVLGAAMLVSSPVSAAIVSYSMAFKDNTGATVGTGSFSFDPAVKMDILVDAVSGRSCDLFPSMNCIVGATLTPLASFLAMIGSQTFTGPQLNAAEGSYGFDSEGVLLLAPGNWFVDDPSGAQLFIDFGSLSDQTAIRTFIASIPGQIEIAGTVDFTRLPPIPLPAGAVLFFSGLAAFAGLRRKSIGRLP